MTTITLSIIQSTAKAELTQAQKAFIKQPSSLNWIATTRAMMVYQQASSHHAHRIADLLVAKVTPLPMGEWPEAIVQCTLGMSIDEAIKPA
jgi:hypothetical protein